jgi:hypothetical protein
MLAAGPIPMSSSDEPEVADVLAGSEPVGGSAPWWSLTIFHVCIYVIHGVFVYDDERAARGT